MLAVRHDPDPAWPGAMIDHGLLGPWHAGFINTYSPSGGDRHHVALALGLRLLFLSTLGDAVGFRSLRRESFDQSSTLSRRFLWTHHRSGEYCLDCDLRHARRFNPRGHRFALLAQHHLLHNRAQAA